MKKLFCLLLSAVFVSGIAFSSKAPRSMKAGAEKILTIKKASELAKNYQLEDLSSSVGIEKILSSFDTGKLKLSEHFVAKGENDECVMLLIFRATDKHSEFSCIKFAYCSLNGSATSKLEYKLPIGTFYLNNFDKQAVLDSGTHELHYDSYDAQTADMVRFRENTKAFFGTIYRVKFIEEINDEQKKFMPKKSAPRKNSTKKQEESASKEELVQQTAENEQTEPSKTE